MGQRRVRLDYCRDWAQEELEQKYICHDPDKVSGVPYNIGNLRLFLQTLPVDGWHLVFPMGEPYLISHSAIKFKAYPAGNSDWENYEAENEKFLRNCYSCKALGSMGSGLTTEQYETLGSWIKSTAGNTPTYLKSKSLDTQKGFFQIAVATGDKVGHCALSNEFMEASRGIYTFRPTVKLSLDMYLVFDDEYDGSTPEKGLRLEPANGYDPSKFDLTISVQKEAHFEKAMQIIGELKSMDSTSSWETKVSKLEELVIALKSVN